jgi:hypothetical protein
MVRGDVERLLAVAAGVLADDARRIAGDLAARQARRQGLGRADDRQHHPCRRLAQRVALCPLAKVVVNKAGGGRFGVTGQGEGHAGKVPLMSVAAD